MFCQLYNSECIFSPVAQKPRDAPYCYLLTYAYKLQKWLGVTLQMYILCFYTLHIKLFLLYFFKLVKVVNALLITRFDQIVVYRHACIFAAKVHKFYIYNLKR